MLGSAALVTAATLAGCRSDPGPGSVVISYVLGNFKTCEEVGVTEVEAILFRGSFEQPTAEYSEQISCSATGEVEVDGVPPDTYEVRVIGYDQNGVATFDNLGQSASARSVEVFDDAESSFDADLTARPAELLVRWRLGDQGFGNCVGVGIARFEIAAYQTGGGTQLLSAVVDCEAAGGSDGYRLIPDPDRKLNGVLFGEVGVQAIAADGDKVGLPATFEFDPPGAGYSVQLGIECTDAGCISE
ncbi:MAG: hypothetical protein R6X02_22685 [Enhygromyxa sp.]